MVHDVDVTFPEQKLGKADVIFKVKVDDDVIGTLKVSRGNLIWIPKGNSTRGYKLTWAKFAEFLEKSGRIGNV